MTLRLRLLFAALVPLAASLALPVHAHEYWLAPSRYQAGPGDAVAIGALTGEGFTGERKRFARERAVRFVVRAARELDLSPVGTEDDTTWARFEPGDRGGGLFAYQSGFAHLTLEAAKFEHYLAEDGLEGPLETRRARGETGPGRERYRRCAKAWLAGGDTRRATEPVGLPCEIVPLTSPGTDSLLAIRVLFEGHPLPGALVNAWRQPLERDGRPIDPARRSPTERVWSGRTDPRGEIVVPVRERGEWLIGTVHMVPSRDRETADWESTWASLTFAR